MTDKQKALIDELIAALPQSDKVAYEKIIGGIVVLGYIPQKNRSYLSFKHKTNGKIIAKIRSGDIRIKFFACKNVPEKYVDALRTEAEATGNQHSLPVPQPDSTPLPAGVIMKKCTLQCKICTGGGMRYYHKFPDGKEIFRCGAYPVSIPDIGEGDIADVQCLISEQHSYFLSIT